MFEILKPLSEHLQEALEDAELDWQCKCTTWTVREVIKVREYRRTQNILEEINLDLCGSWIIISFSAYLLAGNWEQKSFDLNHPESIDNITEAICESIKYANHAQHCGLFCEERSPTTSRAT